MSPAPSPRAERLLTKLGLEITTAALAFEGRWTMAALRRAEPGLARRLDEALEMWRAAAAGYDEDKIQQYGPMVCRGYRKCVEVMAVLGQAEDAYLFGRDPRTGFTVSIGGKPAAARVAELYPGIPHYTPDEIAMLLAERDLSAVNQVMAAFPGAEIIETRTKGAA